MQNNREAVCVSYMTLYYKSHYVYNYVSRIVHADDFYILQDGWQSSSSKDYKTVFPYK